MKFSFKERRYNFPKVVKYDRQSGADKHSNNIELSMRLAKALLLNAITVFGFSTTSFTHCLCMTPN